MTEAILRHLVALEREHAIKILYACESGSRAWGFASPDSDFDVRFIYTRPKDDYLSLSELSDHAGLPVNERLDISGWDIRKTLTLFLKSNSVIYEWLQSPIVYREESGFTQELRDLMPSYFNLRAGGHHYLSMACNTLTQDLQGRQVKLKRYFYALRPALACLWIIGNHSVPPMEFGKLRTIIADDQLQQELDKLLKQKEQADEKELIASIPVLQQWLETTLQKCKEAVGMLPSDRKPVEVLNQLFRKHLLV